MNCCFYISDLQCDRFKNSDKILSMGLLSLPDVVLIRILLFVGTYDMVVNVSRVCKQLYNFIHSTSSVWRHVSLEHKSEPLIFSSVSQLDSLFRHAQCFHCVDLPGTYFTFTIGNQFDRCINENLIKSQSLVWLDLTGTPVISLSFLQGCTNLKTLLLGECSLIPETGFNDLSYCKKLDYFDAGFTGLTGNILANVIDSPICHLELCAIKFDITDLTKILLKCSDTILSIRMELKEEVTKEHFLKCIQSYQGVCFSLWQPKFNFYN